MNVRSLSLWHVWPEGSIFKLKPHDTRRIARTLCDKEKTLGHVSRNACRFQLAFSPQRHTRFLQPASRFFEDSRHFCGILMRCASDFHWSFHASVANACDCSE